MPNEKGSNVINYAGDLGQRASSSQRQKQNQAIKHDIRQKLHRDEQQAELDDYLDLKPATSEPGEYEAEDCEPFKVSILQQLLLPSSMPVNWLLRYDSEDRPVVERLRREPDYPKQVFLEAVCMHQGDFLRSGDIARISLMPDVRKHFGAYREKWEADRSEEDASRASDYWSKAEKLRDFNEYSRLGNSGRLINLRTGLTVDIRLLTHTSTQAFGRPDEAVFRVLRKIAEEEHETGCFVRNSEELVDEIRNRLISAHSPKRVSLPVPKDWFPIGRGASARRSVLPEPRQGPES